MAQLLHILIKKNIASAMRKILLIIIAIAFTAVATYAQKAEVKNDEILSDGKAIAKIEKDGWKQQ